MSMHLRGGIDKCAVSKKECVFVCILQRSRAMDGCILRDWIEKYFLCLFIKKKKKCGKYETQIKMNRMCNILLCWGSLQSSKNYLCAFIQAFPVCYALLLCWVTTLCCVTS